MIPRYDIAIDPNIPANASFWVPRPEDLEGEGDRDGDAGIPIGEFHDTWLIETSLDEAREVLNAEQVAVVYSDENSATAEDFENVAGLIEFEVPDVPSDEAPPFILETEWYGVEGLELGVSGLVHALNAVGIVTAASCRSHAASHQPWADYPIVCFAASRRQVEILQPLVREAGCGFEMDEVDRPNLIAICGPSILEMMDLGRAVLGAEASFAVSPTS